MKYRCDICGHIFDESEAKWVDIDSSGNDVCDSERVMDTLPVCPNCNSDVISEYYGDDVKEEKVKEVTKDNSTFFKNNSSKLDVDRKTVKTWKDMIDEVKRNTSGKIIGSKLREEFNTCIDDIESGIWRIENKTKSLSSSINDLKALNDCLEDLNKEMDLIASKTGELDGITKRIFDRYYACKVLLFVGVIVAIIIVLIASGIDLMKVICALILIGIFFPRR